MLCNVYTNSCFLHDIRIGILHVFLSFFVASREIKERIEMTKDVKKEKKVEITAKSTKAIPKGVAGKGTMPKVPKPVEIEVFALLVSCW